MKSRNTARSNEAGGFGMAPHLGRLCFSWRPVFVLVFAAALGAPDRALSQDEPAEPAGELPVEDSPDGPGPEASTAEAPLTPGGLPSGDLMKEDPGVQETWESYSDVSEASMAQEVTKGIRVEDIVEPPSDYRYAAFGKADPFVPPLLAEEELVGPEALEIPILSPLQRCGLTELGTALVGIWQLPSGERKAMVMAPASCAKTVVGVVVRTGDPIGNKGGKVLGIGRDYLIVREFTLAPDGTRQYDDRQLYLGPPNQEAPSKLRFTPGSDTPEIVSEQTDRVVPPGGRGAYDTRSRKPNNPANPYQVPVSDGAANEGSGLPAKDVQGDFPKQSAQPATSVTKVPAPAAEVQTKSGVPVAVGAAATGGIPPAAPAPTGGSAVKPNSPTPPAGAVPTSGQAGSLPEVPPPVP